MSDDVPETIENSIEASPSREKNVTGYEMSSEMKEIARKVIAKFFVWQINAVTTMVTDERRHKERMWQIENSFLNETTSV